MADSDRLRKLIKLTDNESDEGNWRITLDYDNYQDGARVLNGDGVVIAECYDIDKSPDEQFIAAIDLAIASNE